MQTTKRLSTVKDSPIIHIIVACTIAAAPVARLPAADQPQWGERYTRNMISSETGLPETFDPKTGKNIKWTVELGSQTHSTPVIGSGKVLIATNNDSPRDSRNKGDRGVLYCLDEKDGKFLWQLAVPKLDSDPYLDWPHAGMVSTATIEGDLAYVVSNRGEVLCLDLQGQSNGNDGPYVDEGRHTVPPGQAPLAVTQTDADIVWMYDIVAQSGIHQHDSAHCSILLHGQYLYVCTSNGVDNTHLRIRSPDAPSLIVLDKTTGRLVAQDGERIGPRIIHCTWSSPALGTVNGQQLVFFGGGDGVCYAFEAYQPFPATGSAATLKKIWSFDCDPSGPKENVHEYQDNFSEGPSNIKSMPVFYKDRVYVTVGGDFWHGKHEAWLKCIDATKSGDVTKGGEIWSYALMRHCMSTPSIHDGLVFIADCGKYVHCLDAETGRPFWTHETKGEIWGSTLVADGKVFIGTRRGDFWVFAAAKEKRVLGSVDLRDPLSASPVAAGGVLYVATMRRLYAISK